MPVAVCGDHSRVDSVNGLTVATVVLAAATFGLVLVATAQLWLSRVTLARTIRPLLVDPTDRPSTTENETLLFGPPNRPSVTVSRGALFFQQSEGAFHLSVAFENAGGGVAAIVGADVEPPIERASIHVAPRFVAPDSLVRVNISVLVNGLAADRFTGPWWAMDPLTVVIRYTDADGRQPMTSRACLSQAATKGPWVSKVALFAGRRERPLGVGRGDY